VSEALFLQLKLILPCTLGYTFGEEKCLPFAIDFHAELASEIDQRGFGSLAY